MEMRVCHAGERKESENEKLSSQSGGKKGLPLIDCKQSCQLIAISEQTATHYFWQMFRHKVIMYQDEEIACF